MAGLPWNPCLSSRLEASQSVCFAQKCWRLLLPLLILQPDKTPKSWLLPGWNVLLVLVQSPKGKALLEMEMEARWGVATKPYMTILPASGHAKYGPQDPVAQGLTPQVDSEPESMGFTTFLYTAWEQGGPQRWGDVSKVLLESGLESSVSWIPTHLIY